MQYLWKQTIMPTLSLFTSVGTLVCCALPALFVTLGSGAALAGLVSNVPWLIALSKYKIGVFTIAGIMLLLGGMMRWQSRYAACPADFAQAKACDKLRKVSGWMYWISVGIYAIGFFFAFIAVRLFY